MQKRPRIAGFDLFLQAREQVPLDIAGMETEAFGGLGDIPYRDLHRRMAEYRFLYSPIRYTSLPLAVIEGMTIGMPIVALATTELPTVIEHGTSGFLSCDPGELLEAMRYLLAHPEEARRMGNRARATAEQRFSLDRFTRAWNAAFTSAIELNRASTSLSEVGARG
jgi:glycosyltransferase involved in cell wall biosynthesis